MNHFLAALAGKLPLSLLETQFFTRRVLRREAERGNPVPQDLASLAALVEQRRTELKAELRPTLGLRLELLDDQKRAEEIRTLRRELAEASLLRLRLRELSDEYRLEGEAVLGPWGSLIPPDVLATIPDRVRGNKQAYGRLASIDESSNTRKPAVCWTSSVGL